MVNRESGTGALQERKLEDILTLLDLPDTQQHIVRKYMKPLIDKIHSMHFVMTGVL